MATRQETGKLGEEVAAEFLKKRGIEILVRNARCPLGEIDLVGREGKTVVFVEVKARHSADYGLPQESVSRNKQKKLTLLAQWYLKKHRLEGQPARFDVVAVTWANGEPQISWIVNAFEACR